MFFDGWYDLLRPVIVGPCAYASLVFLLRITGKRTLSKMNAFDLVVTVAFGLTLASMLLSSDVSLTEGLSAFALLCVLQYVVTFASVRSERFQHLVKADPTLLFHRGMFLHSPLKKERVTKEEIIAALRAQGTARLENVRAVVLETDGSLSVITDTLDDPIETLRHVQSGVGTTSAPAGTRVNEG